MRHLENPEQSTLYDLLELILRAHYNWPKSETTVFDSNSDNEQMPSNNSCTLSTVSIIVYNCKIPLELYSFMGLFFIKFLFFL